MPRYIKGDIAYEVTSPTFGARLKAAGFKEQAARTKRVKAADAEKETSEPKTVPPLTHPAAAPATPDAE